eukprot:sb/3470165/
MLLTVNDGQRPLMVPNEVLMLPSLVKSAEQGDGSASSTDQMGTDGGGTTQDSVNTPNPNNLQVISEKHGAFLESLKEHKSGEFVQSVCQLAHDDTKLAEHLWVSTFPEVFATLKKEQQHRLSRDLPPFLCDAMHHDQGELQPSSIGCFLQVLGEYPVTESKDRIQYEAVDCLIALYSQLNEHDMWTGIEHIIPVVLFRLARTKLTVSTLHP